MQHRTLSERKASFWIKVRPFLYHRDKIVRRTPSLRATNRCCYFQFFTCNSQQMMMFSVLSDPVLFFQAVSTFSDHKLLLQFLGFVFIGGISRCLQFLDTTAVVQSCSSKLHFSRMFLIPELGSQADSFQAGRPFSVW